MKLTFIGAAHEVTGSCHCLEVNGKKILVDYGMEQGVNQLENAPMPFHPAEVDYLLITHAHVDHTGMLPKLYADGFRGEVYATSATTKLCGIMLRDCAHIQESDAEYQNRKRRRRGEPEIPPTFTMADAEGVLNKFHPCHYGVKFELCKGIFVRFRDAGHLLGSASIEMWLSENGVSRKIVFSGDIGNLEHPLIKNPDPPEDADYVLMESTYGDRSHGDKPDYEGQLTEILRDTVARGGNLVIPAFAVGRTQEMLYFIRRIMAEKAVPGLEKMEVWVDSPLAIEATKIFDEMTYECFDEETLQLIESGHDPLEFDQLRLSITSEESKLINTDPKPKIIISSSGMCDAGRIRHHLKHNLWRADSTVVFAGYQAVGTLGRTLLDGADTVRLFGEPINVAAKIVRIGGISGHADKNGLLGWIGAFKKKPQKVFVVHGDDAVADSFAKDLREQMGLDAEAPYSGSSFDLVTGEWIHQAAPVKFVKKKDSRTASLFERLIAAANRLLSIAKKYEKGANKDISKFTDQITALCEKWDK